MGYALSRNLLYISENLLMSVLNPNRIMVQRVIIFYGLVQGARLSGELMTVTTGVSLLIVPKDG
jgi:hypothetical protein